MVQFYDLSDQLQNEVVQDIMGAVLQDEAALVDMEQLAKKLYIAFCSHQHLIDILFSGNQASVNQRAGRKLCHTGLFITGVALRYNAKLTSTESTGFFINTDTEIKENEPIIVSFLGEMEYHIWGNEIKLHTVNLLCNAFVKSIEKVEDGKIRVLYGDVESNPMYISYKGYMTEDEARAELKHVMEHKEEYEKAKTAQQYLNDHCFSHLPKP